MVPKRLPRALALLALATVTSTALSGCIVLPAFMYEFRDDPVLTEPPQPPDLPPVDPPTGNDVQADPLPQEVVDPASVEALGPYLDGQDEGSLSGLSHDRPTDVVVPPSFGDASPWGDRTNPYGEETRGTPFMQRTQPGSVYHLMQSTVGRIYAGNAGTIESTCSGTVVNSESGSLLLSAGHCFWDFERGRSFEEILFVPGDRDNGFVSPWGLWHIDEVFYPREFTENATIDADGFTAGSGWALDFAFAAVAPNQQGQRIEDVTGGQGLSFAQRYSGVLNVGYPSVSPFDGKLPRYCSTSSTNFGNLYWPHVTVRCDQTGGSSGSGWVTGVDPTTGAGYVTAVTSTGNAYTTAEPPWMQSGALLGSIAHEVMQTADAAA